jgi:cytochrome c-type biogenesis protein CcmE
LTSRRFQRPVRWRIALLVLGVTGVLVLVLGAALDGTLTYYRTPSQLAASSAGTVRLGGTVVPGSLHTSAGVVTFALTDGKATTRVRTTSIPPSSFRQGQNAVVEGVLRDGEFDASSVMVKHSEKYSARTTSAEPAGTP